VIRTKPGYVIFKITEHQMAGIPPLKDVEPKIMDALYYEKLQPALRAYLTKLREEAYIDVKEGYTDSGASLNETKPVETSAAKENDAKNLKKKEKESPRRALANSCIANLQAKGAPGENGGPNSD